MPDTLPEPEEPTGTLQRMGEQAETIYRTVGEALGSDTHVPRRVAIGLGLTAAALFWCAVSTPVAALIGFLGLWIVMVHVLRRR